MPDLGCSLVSFEVAHPEAVAIRDALQPCLNDARVRFMSEPRASLRATIRTPQGERRLV